MWTVYVVRCSDDSLYVGITDDLEERIAKHNAGKGAKYTRARRPVELAFEWKTRSATRARRLEVALKRLPRAKRRSSCPRQRALARPACGFAFGDPLRFVAP